MQREETRQVMVGSLPVGGKAPVSIQSMTNTKTENKQETVAQIKALQEAGCDIVRVAVPHKEAGMALKDIKKAIDIPLVADIHFDYRLALLAAEQGVDKIRINPGNIGSVKRIQAVVAACKEKKIPIRIGVNSGSVDADILARYGKPSPEALVASALKHVTLLEDQGFDDIVVSIKASDIMTTYQACHLFSKERPYPLHLGITEAGTIKKGTIKSAAGLGLLLGSGLGNTIRVSLTGDPLEEVYLAKQVLQDLGLRESGVTFISCPTCGRTEIDLIGIAQEVEARLEALDIKKKMTLAVMGCIVNGPGEAKEADLGIAGGKGQGLIFKKGEIIKKVKEDQLIDALMDEIRTLQDQ